MDHFPHLFANSPVSTPVANSPLRQNVEPELDSIPYDFSTWHPIIGLLITYVLTFLLKW